MSTVANISNSANVYESLNVKKETTSTADATQDRFLKLLIQQLKSQDPLNPMDSAQSTSQMAQINTVSGIEKLNTSMNDMAKSFTSGQSYQAAALIGRSVMAEGSNFSLTGDDAKMEVDIPKGSGRVTMTIYDENNRKVSSQEINATEAGRQVVEWDGKDESGNLLPGGKYQVSAVAEASDGSTQPLKTYTFTKVDSVSVSGEGVMLRLADQRGMPFSSVTQIM